MTLNISFGREVKIIAEILRAIKGFQGNVCRFMMTYLIDERALC